MIANSRNKAKQNCQVQLAKRESFAPLTNCRLLTKNFEMVPSGGADQMLVGGRY